MGPKSFYSPIRFFLFKSAPIPILLHRPREQITRGRQARVGESWPSTVLECRVFHTMISNISRIIIVMNQDCIPILLQRCGLARVSYSLMSNRSTARIITNFAATASKQCTAEGGSVGLLSLLDRLL